ncbi:hypothetical protein [Couchioplanes azureus]|uniref:hypothetical protein n=1 Tax=Couchioplanes caeruleus TaxID=56438 RepID=UPI00166FB313|nr:hypothetical protein [Couchioplanes caeruleus]GGQ77650.1 hypothetical protein GCM10010166_54510 [Couchioplanes caeruleus subsp. azureus]
MNASHDPGGPVDPDQHWWPRLADRINRWWMDRESTRPALREMAAIPPKPALAAILAGTAVLVLLIVALVWWLIAAITGVISAIADAIRETSGHATDTAVNDLTTWSITRTITDPVHTYLSTHAAGLPIAGETLWWTWLATTGGMLLLATLGSRGARLGWPLTGALTTAMVYTATPTTGQTVAAGLAITVWAVLSIAAYNRLTALERAPLILRLPIPHRPQPDKD